MAPLVRKGRLPSVRDKVLTVTTPGETVDVVVTEMGYAVNPKRQDLIEALADCPLHRYTIEELRDEAVALAGKQDEIEFTDQVVALVEYRDGTIIDVVKKVK
jgi:citrate lyase subunit alpha/citrate CoA-transferase